MAMRPCSACLDNRWQLAYAEGIMTATCQSCAREVSFPASKPKQAKCGAKPDVAKVVAVGQPCRKCGTPVKRRSHNKPPKDNGGGYYFEWWLRCPRCRALYMVEAAKRYFQVSAELPVEAAPSVSDNEYFAPGFNTPGIPAATQPDPVEWAAKEAAFVDDGRAPWE